MQERDRVALMQLHPQASRDDRRDKVQLLTARLPSSVVHPVVVRLQASLRETSEKLPLEELRLSRPLNATATKMKPTTLPTPDPYYVTVVRPKSAASSIVNLDSIHQEQSIPNVFAEKLLSALRKRPPLVPGNPYRTFLQFKFDALACKSALHLCRGIFSPCLHFGGPFSLEGGLRKLSPTGKSCDPLL